MTRIKPILGALALAALLAARIAPDYAEAVMLGAADSLGTAELPCAVQLIQCPLARP